MIRILYVHHGKGIGGAPLSLLYLIRALDRSRYFPTVLCLYESEAADLFRREGIETIVARKIHDFSHTNVSWYDLPRLPKLVHRLFHLPFAIERASKFLRAHPCEIVHLNTSTLLAFGIAARRAGIRVVWHIREPLHRGYFGLRRRMIRGIIDRNADLILPICRYDAEQLTPSEKIRVVYNFIDFRKFDAGIAADAERKELGIPAGAKTALMLGGVNRIKGTLPFVRAARQVLASHPDSRFLVAGPIPPRSLRSRLNGSASYLGAVRREIGTGAAAERIRLLGNRMDIPELLSLCSLLCFPSTVPHFARPVIEASAMGKPVVASDLGGPNELVIEGETGTLVPPDRDDLLAAAIRGYFDDPARCATEGQRGMALARERFSAEKNSAEIVALYEQLLNK